MSTTIVAAEDCLLRLKQGADRLNVAEGTLRGWVKCGRIPYHRVGRLIMVRAGDLSKFVADSRIVA